MSESKYDGFTAHLSRGGFDWWYLSDGIRLYLRDDGEIASSTPHWYRTEEAANTALQRFKVIEVENAAIDLENNLYTIRYQGAIMVLMDVPGCCAFVDIINRPGRQKGTGKYIWPRDTAEECIEQAKKEGYKVTVVPVSSDWSVD